MTEHSPEAVVARLLCQGYNTRVTVHGPDPDGAIPGGARFTVVHDGTVYEVTVHRGSPPGHTAEVHRTCGILGCNDPEHLVLRYREVSES